MRLLYVDDDLFCQIAVKRLVSPADATLTSATCAEEAIDLLNKQAFDLLVTDFNMPGRSGLDLVRWVKASAAASSINRICLVSDLISDVFEQECLGLGVDAVFQKPLTPTLIPKVLCSFSTAHVAAVEYDPS